MMMKKKKTKNRKDRRESERKGVRRKKGEWCGVDSEWKRGRRIGSGGG